MVLGGFRSFHVLVTTGNCICKLNCLLHLPWIHVGLSAKDSNSEASRKNSAKEAENSSSRFIAKTSFSWAQIE